MYVILAKIHHSRLEPYVLIDNPLYNPSVRVGRFSGRPVSAGPSDFSKALAADLQANGQRNPICVWEVGGKYFVAYGAARVRAAKTTPGLEFLTAIISGPGDKPPATIEPEQTLDPHIGIPWCLICEDPPLHWRVEPEGYLYFDGCVSGFDEVHNPEGAKALRNRGPEVNNGLSSVRPSVQGDPPGGPEPSPPEPPPWDVKESSSPGVNVTVHVDDSRGPREILPPRSGQRRGASRGKST